MTSFSLRISVAIGHHHHQRRPTITTSFSLPWRQPPSSVVTFSRRKSSSSSSDITPKTHKKKSKQVSNKNIDKNDELDGDPFEALFKMLEEDLENDELSLDDIGDEISEEEMKKLEEELEEALKDDELFAAFGSNVEKVEEETELDEEDEDNKEMEDKEDDGGGVNQLQLKTWQQRRLAQALKKGRRKSSIKNLAADLCLDRAIVLDILREPPPSLLMLSAALPDEPSETTLEPVPKAIEPVTTEVEVSLLEQASDDSPEIMLVDTETEKLPVHVMQRSWSAKKRLKRVQLETLERVYGRTKRPTNAMISSIVHVTNLPRKKVVKWFEDKRSEEGVPNNRVPYQPSASKTASIQ
ncbi:hypothetical protein Leryth_013511 [Lithospermum erythrorhizon]|nr:hypothetical protein Leryth_013511 [Lithospermum erythrorhizon]